MLKTTSSLIAFYSQMEEDAARFYEKLSERYTDQRDTFKGLAEENLRHRDMIQRAYREGVTDAFEVGFLAGALNEADYAIDTDDSDESGVIEALEKAIRIEEGARSFCRDAVKTSSELLPDIPDTFERIAIRKSRRREGLESLQRELLD